MSDNYQSDNSEERQQEENERRVDHLINLVEKHTRTERHLEQYADSGITSPEALDHEKEIQKERESEISNLKNIITSGEHSNNDQLTNVQKQYKFEEGYINHNAEHMNSQALENAKEKQKHREEQIDSLQ